MGNSGEEYITSADYDRITDTFFASAIVIVSGGDDIGSLISMNPITELLNFVLDLTFSTFDVTCDWLRVDQGKRVYAFCIDQGAFDMYIMAFDQDGTFN